MCKAAKTVFLFTIVFSFCNACSDHNKPLNYRKQGHIGKTKSYDFGDCFLFKDSIPDFGLVFLNEEIYPEGRMYKLFPLKLNHSKTGMDKFNFGQIYIQSFRNDTNIKGYTEGFHAYVFLDESNYESIKKFLRYEGTLSFESKYQNATGGSVASDLSELIFKLDRWDKVFGNGGKLVDVNSVIKK